MEKIKTDGNDELEKFRLHFSRCANRDLAPFISVARGNVLGLSVMCTDRP